MNWRHVLLGDRPEVRRRYGAAAVVVGFLAALIPIGVRVSGSVSGPGGDMEALGFVLVLLLVSGIVALTLPIIAGYRGAGLIVCIGIPTCLIFGFDIAYWTSASVDTLRWTLWQWNGPPLGLLLGLPLGGAGYLVGTGLCRLRESLPTTHFGSADSSAER
jgi:hypothetical protein